MSRRRCDVTGKSAAAGTPAPSALMLGLRKDLKGYVRLKKIYMDRYISTGKILDSEEGIRGQAAQERHVVDVWSPLMCEVLLCRGLPARESAASAAKSCTVSSIFILSVYSFVCVLFIRATCYNVFQNRVM